MSEPTCIVSLLRTEPDTKQWELIPWPYFVLLWCPCPACRSTELNRSVLLTCTRVLCFPHDSWGIPGILAISGIADHNFTNCVCLLWGILPIIAVHPPTSMITFDGFILLEYCKFRALNDGSKGQRKIRCLLSWPVQDWHVTDVRLAEVSFKVNKMRWFCIHNVIEFLDRRCGHKGGIC